MNREPINGTAIRKARKRADLTQAALARKAKIPQPTLSLWETGRTQTTNRGAALKRVARVLKVDVAEISKAPRARKRREIVTAPEEPEPEREEAA